MPVITLTFLVLLMGLAWLAQVALQRARSAMRLMAVPRSRAAIAGHVPASQSLA
jgi:hypothetical protein